MRPQSLLRGATEATIRGGRPRSRLRRWLRWLPVLEEPSDPRFQGPDEPFPDHWRQFPRPWAKGDPESRAALLRDGLRTLPDTWRAAALRGTESPADAPIRHRAVTALRDLLDTSLDRRSDG